MLIHYEPLLCGCGLFFGFLDHLSSLYWNQGDSGIVVCRTEQHFVVSVYRHGMLASVCVEATETLGFSFFEIIFI